MKFISYLLLCSVCCAWQENTDGTVDKAPTSEEKDRWGGAGGWCPASSLGEFTELLKNPGERPGTDLGEPPPLLEVARTESDIPFTSELLELVPLW